MNESTFVIECVWCEGSGTDTDLVCIWCDGTGQVTPECIFCDPEPCDCK